MVDTEDAASSALDQPIDPAMAMETNDAYVASECKKCRRRRSAAVCRSMNGMAAPPTPSTRTPSNGNLDPDLDASRGRRDGKQGDHERHGDPVTDHLDGEGLGWRPGDGEIGDDHLRQAWNPGDIHLECPCGKSPCAACSLARCLTKPVEGQVTSYATQIVECSLQGQWGGEEPSQHEHNPLPTPMPARMIRIMTVAP